MSRLIVRAVRVMAPERAVAFALVGRLWQLLAGIVTLVMVARYFTAEVQGFYYTFASLLALQSFVELGFFVVIINVASHEWARLGLDSDGRIVGDANALSRLISLARLIFRWYAVASVLFVLTVGAIGYWFFSQANQHDVSWQAPWFTLVAITGVQLWVLPFTSLLEGCNQVETVNRFRLFQVIVGAVSFWLVLVLGGGLWGAVAMASVRLVSDLSLVLVRYRHFFAALRRPAAGPGFEWRTEIWPMQWRLAMSGIVNYFAYSLFNPVMFHYHGSAVAGQMGMTLQAVGGLQALSMVWISTKAPKLGMLIAERNYSELDKAWLRASISAVAFLVVSASVFWALVYALNAGNRPLTRRMLGVWPTTLLLLAAVIMQIAQCLTIYMRAHKQEPILVMSVTTSLAIGFSVWALGSRFGPTGAASAYLSVMIALVLWESAIWLRFRSASMAAAGTVTA